MTLAVLPSSVAIEFDPGSYRDRGSRVFYRHGAVYRALNAEALAEWERLQSTAFFRQCMADGRLVRTEQVPPHELADELPGEEWAAVVRHERIPFISYPYEWPFRMLQDAALLHLELLQAALDEQMILKDATPFNVQWNGARPVFIDVPSFIALQPGEPWIGYRQFCQMFLYPLLLQAYRDLPFQPWLRGSLEGIEPGQCWNLLSARDLVRPGVLTHVFLHAQLQQRFQQRNDSTRRALATHGFDAGLIRRNVTGLLRLVHRLRWQPKSSKWSDYTVSSDAAQRDGDEKTRFVAEVAGLRRWDLVWDLGCNTGRYARIAAEQAESVVAMDADAVTVERLYRELKAEGRRRILPLLVNLADPSPNLGWDGQERRGLPERGRPDLTLCLALIHHLVIGANIPLASFVEWLARLQTHLVIEFVAKEDPMVQSLLRNKADQYADYDGANFERELSRHFVIRRRVSLPTATRTLYYASPRSEARS